MRVFVDCDPGIDDAVALAYLAARPGIEIVGVGAVFGNNGVDTTADNALRLLELYGRGGVPVARGAARPVARPFAAAPRPAVHVHGPNGLGGVELPPPAHAVVAESAAELLVGLCRRSPGEIDVLAVGPLTNLALALALEPGLPGLVGRLVVMGGALRVPGNITPWAEFNVHSDPEAAEAVFAAGFDMDLVALDVTMKAVATEAWLEELARVPGERARRTSAFLDFYADWYAGVFGVRQCAMHDPLAAAVLADPELVTGSFAVPVRVELSGEHTRGMTVADLRPGPGTDDPRGRVRVVTGVNGPAFLKRMTDALR